MKYSKMKQKEFDLVLDGLIAIVQKGNIQTLRKMSEDPKLKVKDILNYAKEVDKSIDVSKWYRNDQTIKPRGQG